MRQTGHRDLWWLLTYVLAINIALTSIRFLWVWVSLSLTVFEPIAEAHRRAGRICGLSQRLLWQVFGA